LEQMLRDGHLARFEPREPGVGVGVGAARLVVPGMKDGSCCAVMKSICENVSAVPVPSQTSQSETQGLDWIGENALAIAYGGGSCIIGVWMDRRRFYTVRTDIRLCAEQFLVNPDIPTAIVMKDRSTQKPEPITYEQQPPKTKNSIKE